MDVFKDDFFVFQSFIWDHWHELLFDWTFGSCTSLLFLLNFNCSASCANILHRCLLAFALLLLICFDLFRRPKTFLIAADQCFHCTQALQILITAEPKLAFCITGYVFGSKNLSVCMKSDLPMPFSQDGIQRQDNACKAESSAWSNQWSYTCFLCFSLLGGKAETFTDS